MPQHAQIITRLQTQYATTWKSLEQIQKKFASRGFNLFLVGGAVRNLVLGTVLKDFDLASDALPQDVIGMFRHVIPTGIQHGTVTLVYQGEHFEITTFRVDGDYSDSRRPDSVAFTPNILEDLTRRDFTINAMALDLSDLSLLDPHNGQGDLAAGLIRTVGAPMERFSEDGLRIVRGIRFAAQLGFQIESKTYAAMKLCLDRLAKVSIERFRDELSKTLEANLPSRGLFLMRETGIFPLFIPALASLPPADFALAALTVDLLPPTPPELRLAACLMFLETGMTTHVCTSLKLSNNSNKTCSLLVSLLDQAPDAEMSPAKLRQFAARATRELALIATDLLVMRATAMDWLAWNPIKPPMLTPLHIGTDRAEPLFVADISSPWATSIDDLRDIPDARLRLFRRKLEEILAAHPALTIRDLAIDGNQLIKNGIPPGRNMGLIMEDLLRQVIEKPENNTPEWLLAAALRIHQSTH